MYILVFVGRRSEMIGGFYTRSMMFKDHLSQFLSLKKPNTRRAYFTAVHHLKIYLNSAANFCDQDAAIGYLSEFREGRSDASLKHRYHLLRAYFEYLVNVGAIQSNPFRIIPTLLSMRQHNQVRPTKTLTAQQVNRIINNIDTSKPEGRLVFAFMGLLFGGGLRRSEALALRPADIILEGPGRGYAVHLRGTKSGVTDLQPIPRWLGSIIKKVLDDLKKSKQINGPLFSWSEKTAYRIFRNACLDCGINASPHSFRAAAATLLKEQGEEDRTVANFLRHKTTHMVQVYDHRARKALAKTNKCLEDFFEN